MGTATKSRIAGTEGEDEHDDGIGVEEEAVDVRDYAAMAIEASSKVTNSFKDQT
jgi:hypothetical protein